MFRLGIFLAVCLLCLAPIWGLLAQVNEAIFTEVLSDPTTYRSIMWTLLTALSASLISVVIAIAFAKVFASWSWRGQRLQRLGLLIPYLVPNFVLVMGYVLCWNSVTGILNSILPFPGGIYGIPGMILLFTVSHVPVAFLLIEDKLKRIDGSLLEAAAISGASRIKIFFKIELPLLRPILISSFGLCFALNVSAFAIPAWLGAPGRVYLLTYKIYQSIQMGGAEGIPEAAALGLILLVISILALGLNSMALTADARYTLVSGKSQKRNVVQPSTRSFSIFQTFYWMWHLVVWIVPLAVLTASTLVPPGCLQSEGLSCLSKISFGRYYYVLFELTETKMAVINTLIYGAISSFIIITAAIILVGLFARSAKLSKLMETVVGIPLATPGAVIALGLIVICSGKYGINLYNTPWIIVMAFVVKHLSLALQPLKTGLMNISPSLQEAARLSGAGTTRVWLKIVLPILRPEYIGGFFLVFIPIVGELTMSVFLTSPSYRSIGTVLFELQDYADQASAGALAVLLIIFILMLNKMARILSRGKLGY